MPRRQGNYGRRWEDLFGEDEREKVLANLASLNEIVTEMATAMRTGAVPDLEWTEHVRRTLRRHSHEIGFEFMGEAPPR